MRDAEHARRSKSAAASRGDQHGPSASLLPIHIGAAPFAACLKHARIPSTTGRSCSTLPFFSVWSIEGCPCSPAGSPRRPLTSASVAHCRSLLHPLSAARQPPALAAAARPACPPCTGSHRVPRRGHAAVAGRHAPAPQRPAVPVFPMLAALGPYWQPWSRAATACCCPLPHMMGHQDRLLSATTGSGRAAGGAAGGASFQGHRRCSSRRCSSSVSEEPWARGRGEPCASPLGQPHWSSTGC